MGKRKGFSSIDLVIYAVGITIFSSGALIATNNYLDSSRTVTAKAQATSIAAAVSQYKYEIGNYPPNIEALTGTQGIYGKWLVNLPTSDPFGNTNGGIDGNGGTSAYCYAYDNSGFAIWSVGKNKTNNSGGNGTTLPISFIGDDKNTGVFGQ